MMSWLPHLRSSPSPSSNGWANTGRTTGLPWQYQDTQEAVQVPRELPRRVSEPDHNSLSTFLPRLLWVLSSPSFCRIKDVNRHGGKRRGGGDLDKDYSMWVLRHFFWSRGLPCMLSSLPCLRGHPPSEGLVTRQNAGVAWIYLKVRYINTVESEQDRG